MSTALYRQMARSITATAATLVVAAAAAQPSLLESNKRVATEFYDAAINRKDFAAASQYLGSAYKQHNPTAADGADGLRAFIDFLKTRFPNQRGEFKRVVAEGDLVVLHVHSTRGDGTPGRAIVDIFRIENGKVVEHWDVIQDIPAQAANQNGMF
jgi:predicted SnoaL-like aldol condensation-catalyzing enzyme